MAALGKENEKGEFEVEDVCFMGLGPQPSLPPSSEETDGPYLCLVSGFNIDAKAKVGGLLPVRHAACCQLLFWLDSELVCA